MADKYVLTLSARTLDNGIIYRADVPDMFSLSVDSFTKQHPKLASKAGKYKIKANTYPLYIPQNSFLWNALIDYAKAMQLRLSKTVDGFVYRPHKPHRGIYFLRPINYDLDKIPIVKGLVPNYHSFVIWVNQHVNNPN